MLAWEAGMVGKKGPGRLSSPAAVVAETVGGFVAAWLEGRGKRTGRGLFWGEEGGS